MATIQELIRDVALELRLQGAGQPVDENDALEIDRRYRVRHAELLRSFTVDWDIDETVPDAALDGMVLLVANRAATRFGREWTLDRERIGMEILKDYRETPYAPSPAMRAVYY